MRLLARVPFVLVVILATLAAHAGALGGRFHYDDDHVILLNRRNLQDPSTVLAMFRDPSVFSGLPGNAMFRPTTYATHVLDAGAWAWEDAGPDPRGWHLTNLLLHAATAGALFLLLRRVLRALAPAPPAAPGAVEGPALAALVGALWFGLHPVNSEVVNYVCARSESTAALFFVLALLLHHRAWDGVAPPLRRAALVAASCGAAFLAFGGKETALLLPAVAGALELWARPRDQRAVAARVGRAAARAVPLAAILVVVLLLRRSALGAATVDLAARPEMSGDGSDPFLGGGRTWAAHFPTQARVLVQYALFLLFPVDLSPDHHVRVSASLADGATLGALALLAVGGGLLARSLRRGERLPALATTWTACALAPSVLVPLNVVLNEHRLYLPTTGLALAFGCGALAVLDAAGRSRWPALGAALVCAAFAAFGALDGDRARAWSDPEVLWSRAVEASPGSWRAHHHLGVARFAAAERAFGQADGLEGMDPEGAAAARGRGLALTDAALAEFGRAQEIYPRAFSTRLNLGSAHLTRARVLNHGAHPDDPPPHSADLEAAIRWFTLAEEASPGSGRAQYYRATAQAERGLVEEALAAFLEMDRKDPAHAHLYDFPLADLLRRSGRTDEAIARLDVALARNPADAGTVALKKAEALTGARRFDEADGALRAAWDALGPRDARVYVYMARMLAASGRADVLPRMREFWGSALALGHRPGPKDREVLAALGR